MLHGSTSACFKVFLSPGLSPVPNSTLFFTIPTVGRRTLPAVVPRENRAWPAATGCRRRPASRLPPPFLWGQAVDHRVRMGARNGRLSAGFRTAAAATRNFAPAAQLRINDRRRRSARQTPARSGPRARQKDELGVDVSPAAIAASIGLRPGTRHRTPLPSMNVSRPSMQYVNS